MRKFLHKNIKHGFTLTELCVVMAIAAIVGTMTTTCIIYFWGQKREITSQAKTISEISTAKSAVNDWLRVYDTADYEIIEHNSGKGLIAQKNNENHLVLFDKKTVTADGGSKTDEFESITNLYFNIRESEKTVKVTVVYGKNDEEQVILLPLFSDVTRERVIK